MLINLFRRYLHFLHITMEIITMKITGIRKSDFPTKTGEMIKGYNVYVVDNIDPRHGQGQSAEHFYLSERKLSMINGIDPFALLGHEVKIYYNRYGKVDTIEVLD